MLNLSVQIVTAGLKMLQQCKDNICLLRTKSRLYCCTKFKPLPQCPHALTFRVPHSRAATNRNSSRHVSILHHCASGSESCPTQTSPTTAVRFKLRFPFSVFVTVQRRPKRRAVRNSHAVSRHCISGVPT